MSAAKRLPSLRVSLTLHHVEYRSEGTGPNQREVTIVQIGDTVNLVRKITGELLPMELTNFLTRGLTPAVEVRWKSDRHRYKLDLAKNEVLAINSTQHHRQSMRVWYFVDEKHRKALTEAFWIEKKRGKK